MMVGRENYGKKFNRAKVKREFKRQVEDELAYMNEEEEVDIK